MASQESFMSANDGFVFGMGLVLLMVWSVIWKGIALWKAGRNGHKVWFVVLFLVNTLGILEMVYIFLVSKKFEKKGSAVTQIPHA